jgi:hypothetical protein
LCSGQFRLVEARYGRQVRFWSGKLGFVGVGYVEVRQASLGELGYVLYCVEVRRGISR